jgi:integrase
VQAPARLRPGANRESAEQAQPRRPRRGPDRGLPAAPGGKRGNGSATRNARLAAVHSLFRYAAPRAPEHAAVISQVLAIPPGRRERAIVSYLTPAETDALLAAPDRTTWHGRRDHALLLLAAQTGLRVSELTGLTRQDAHLGTGPHARCHGKGRKDRATPLTSQTVRGAQDLARRGRPRRPGQPAVPHQGRRMALPRRLERLVAKHAATAEDRRKPPRSTSTPT